MKVLKPQKGYQEGALRSSADIVIGGGAAGSGKTYCLLMDYLYDIDNPEFGGVIFRRTSPQIRAEGGLWDTSGKLYPLVGATPRESTLEWSFESGSKLKFSHLEYEKNKLDWQGSQIPFIGFDELTHFSESTFFYLLSRNRSSCGVKPRVRCTCNPDPESWVARLIDWWIDADTGLTIPERDGKIRYFLKAGNDYVWGNSEDEVYQQAKHIIDPAIAASKSDGFQLHITNFIKSITFISGSIYQNTELLKVNPDYLSNLMALGEAEKASLLDGNWKARIDENDIYDYIKFLDIFTNSYVKEGTKRITTDIAMKGSDLLIIFCWSGFRLIDVDWAEKSDGKQVVDKIKNMALKHEVQQSNILYDADGIGGYIDGFIVNSNEFHNGAVPVGRENYKNLKTQCFYKSGDRVNAGGVYVLPEVADIEINGQTVKQHLINERKAIKRDKVDMDGKLCIIPKEAMKIKIGHSPDFMDTFGMSEWFELSLNKLFKTSDIQVGISEGELIMYSIVLGNDMVDTSVISMSKFENNIYIKNVFYGKNFDISYFKNIEEYTIVSKDDTQIIHDLRLINNTSIPSKKSITNATIRELKSYNIIVNDEILQNEFLSVRYDNDAIKYSDYPAFKALCQVMTMKNRLWD